MICPYDSFKAKDCSMCAAYMELNKLDSKRGSVEKVCSLTWRGSQVPGRPIFYFPEQKIDAEWR